MAAGHCPRCGAAVPAGGTFCPACGTPVFAALPSAGSGPPPPPPPPPYYPYPVYPPMAPGWGYPVPMVPEVPRPSPATRAIDRDAIGPVVTAGILALVAAGIGVLSLFSSYIGLSFAATGSPFLGLGSGLVGVSVVQLIVELAIVLMLRRSYARLRTIDYRFATPATLTLVLLIGVVMVIAGFLVLFWGSLAFGACSGTGPTPGFSCSLVPALLGVAVLGVGGIIALVGLIGMLIGIWRLGTRYGSELLQVGAILFVLPLLSIVGAILVLVGALNIRRSLEAPPGFPGPTG